MTKKSLATKPNPNKIKELLKYKNCNHSKKIEDMSKEEFRDYLLTLKDKPVQNHQVA